MKFSCLLSIFALTTSFISFASDFDPQLGPCQYELYGTTTNGSNGPSELLALDPADGTGFSLGTIQGGVERITAIDFSSQGILYAVGEDNNDVSSLMVIHCRAVRAFIIGPTGIPSNNTITDLSFDDNGVLWGYSHNGNGSPADELGTIDLGTGAFTSVGQTGVTLTNGNGLFHDALGNLYHAGGDDLSLLDQSTGAGTYVADLQFFAPALDNPRFTGLDLRDDGVIYGALNDKNQGQGAQPENYIVTLNTLTGVTTFLASPVLNAPGGLSGISFNPLYLK